MPENVSAPFEQSPYTFDKDGVRGADGRYDLRWSGIGFDWQKHGPGICAGMNEAHAKGAEDISRVVIARIEGLSKPRKEPGQFDHIPEMHGVDE